MSAAGVFITFEGGEGCGKSTQLAMLADRFEEAGLMTEVLREPGGTRLGELVRDLLLDPSHGELDARAELLLYEASRAQLVAERIVPALSIGSVVLCDRFMDSTVAYQGHGRGLELDEVTQLNEIATAGVTPDLTILLDIDPALGLERATEVGTDRLESEDMAFHARVRDGFLRLAAGEPGRIVTVDANGTPDEVHDIVMATVTSRLPVIAAALRSARS